MASYQNILKLDELTDKYQKEAVSIDGWVTHLKVDRPFIQQKTIFRCMNKPMKSFLSFRVELLDVLQLLQ